MRNTTKLLHSSILIMCVCTSITFANNQSNPNKMQIEKATYAHENQQNLNEIFIIQTKEINEDSEFFKADIKYPYLAIKQEYLNKHKKQYKQIDSINKAISEDVLKFNKEIKAYSESYKEEYEKNKDIYMKHIYEAFINYEVKYNKNNIISIPVLFYEYSGGIHGLSYLKTYNYDLVSGKQIQLKDLFKEDCDYEGIINKYIQDIIDKNPQDYFSGEYGFNGIVKDQKFYIDKDSIVVYFGEYEIAPYAKGMPEFKVQFEDISNCLIKPLS